jgi:hypothetical protein
VLRRAAGEILVEAKMVYSHNATQAVRAAVGQLFTYRHLLYPATKVDLVALFDEQVGNEYVALLDSLGIAVVWRDGRRWASSRLAAQLGLI